MEVVVYPLSGYVNRLQAMASSAILAGELGAHWSFEWNPTDIAPAPADLVFDTSVLEEHLAPRGRVASLVGAAPESVPQGVTLDRDRRVLTLRGHLRGEQAYMPELMLALAERDAFDAIVIVAGGKFAADGISADDFRDRRSDFYANLTLHPDIESSADTQADAVGPTLALHLRYSDRNLEAPTRRQVRHALETLLARSATGRVFIASDTSEERARWMKQVRALGGDPWTSTAADPGRGAALGVHAALIDWRLLGASQGLVYFSASSFAEEAAVASGHFDASIGLSASQARATWLRATAWGRAALTYPNRHWGKENPS